MTGSFRAEELAASRTKMLTKVYALITNDSSTPSWRQGVVDLASELEASV